MRDSVSFGEVSAILGVTDRLGIHREAVVIPLGTRNPGAVRARPDGKLEIVVDAGGTFDDWLAGLETAIRVVRPGSGD